MNNTFGFIGTGNMGGALARAAAKCMAPEALFLANRTPAKAQAMAAELGCTVADNAWIAAHCGFIFLGVKPQMMAGVLAELAPVLAQRQDRAVLVSMAAGLTIETLQQMAGGDYPVIRIMPNTPVAVGSGVILYDATENVSAQVLAQFCQIMQFAGLVDHLPEKLIDAGSAVAGCGPAFAALFMEALEDGGVSCGLPRQKARQYAQQMLMGTAQLALETGKHPGQMKDEVCSPGGSTIAGVQELEEGALRASVIRAVQASYSKNKELGKVSNKL